MKIMTMPACPLTYYYYYYITLLLLEYAKDDDMLMMCTGTISCWIQMSVDIVCAKSNRSITVFTQSPK